MNLALILLHFGKDYQLAELVDARKKRKEVTSPVVMNLEPTAMTLLLLATSVLRMVMPEMTLPPSHFQGCQNRLRPAAGF